MKEAGEPGSESMRLKELVELMEESQSFFEGVAEAVHGEHGRMHVAKALPQCRDFLARLEAMSDLDDESRPVVAYVASLRKLVSRFESICSVPPRKARVAREPDAEKLARLVKASRRDSGSSIEFAELEEDVVRQMRELGLELDNLDPGAPDFKDRVGSLQDQMLSQVNRLAEASKSASASQRESVAQVFIIWSRLIRELEKISGQKAVVRWQEKLPELSEEHPDYLFRAATEGARRALSLLQRWDIKACRRVLSRLVEYGDAWFEEREVDQGRIERAPENVPVDEFIRELGNDDVAALASAEFGLADDMAKKLAREVTGGLKYGMILGHHQGDRVYIFEGLVGLREGELAGLPKDDPMVKAAIVFTDLLEAARDTRTVGDDQDTRRLVGRAAIDSLFRTREAEMARRISFVLWVRTCADYVHDGMPLERATVAFLGRAAVDHDPAFGRDDRSATKDLLDLISEELKEVAERSNGEVAAAARIACCARAFGHFEGESSHSENSGFDMAKAAFSKALSDARKQKPSKKTRG